MIIIISLEGKDSNTEYNFFNGINIYLKKCEIKIFPFEKAKDSNKRKENIKGWLKYYIGEIYQELKDFKDQKNQKNKLFFIADGDAKQDITSIQRTRDIIIEYIEDNKFDDIIKIENKILLKKGTKFEDLYREIHPKNFFPNSCKKISNYNLFKNFANSVGWINKEGELNFQKIINDMEKTKHPHLKIIKAIFLQEK